LERKREKYKERKKHKKSVQQESVLTLMLMHVYQKRRKFVTMIGITIMTIK
jgi:hypothetical protein